MKNFRPRGRSNPPGKPSVKDASRRLQGILSRSARLGVDFHTLDTVSLLKQACGHQEDGGMLVLAFVISLLTSVLILLVASGHLSVETSCRKNSSEEIHIKTMSWNRLPVERSADTPEDSTLRAELQDLQDHEKPSTWHHHTRLRRQR